MTEKCFTSFQRNPDASQSLAEGVAKVVYTFQDAFFRRQARQSPGPLPSRVVELPKRFAAVRKHVLLVATAPGLNNPARDCVQHHHTLGTGLGCRCRQDKD